MNKVENKLRLFGEKIQEEGPDWLRIGPVSFGQLSNLPWHLWGRS